MKIKKSSSKHLAYFILSYILLWIILFEYILPSNQILPKPSIVILSFGALWEFYKLPVNFIITVSVVYFSLPAAYAVIFLLRNFLIKHTHILSEFVSSLNLFATYIPGIIFGLFLIFWFPYSPYVEFVFAFGTAFFSLLIRLKSEVFLVGHEYIESAQSLGAGEDVIRKQIVWNSAQPGLINHLFDLHFYVWSVLIVFEYIKGQYGLGNIFRLSLQYRDLSALFTNALIIAASIYLGSHLIRYIRNKFYSWSII